MNSIAHSSGGSANGLPAAHALASLGMPIVCGRLDSAGDPDTGDRRWSRWQKQTPGERSLKAADSWHEGDALAGVTGVVYDVLDVDPRNGGTESLSLLSSELGDDGPEVYWTIRTPRGGSHLYVAPLGIGSHNGFRPGLDLKGGNADGTGRGFVFLPPTLRYGRRYRVESEGGAPNGEGACLALRSWIERSLVGGGATTPASSGSGRRPLTELRREVLAADNGEQRRCLMAYVYELERKGIDEAGIIARCRRLMKEITNFKSDKGPWWPARGRGGADFWIKDLMHGPGEVIGDASAGEAAVILSLDSAGRKDFPEDEEFWNARPVLGHIRTWARARLCSPWAVLGECMAEAVCHCPSSFQLPPLVGGNGSLNMLIAVTGRSGDGKNAAAHVARAAFRWSGVMGIVEDKVPRIPLGSGEGLAKNFGFSMRDKDTGSHSLVRTAESVIVTIAEIDTFRALSDRSGSTLSPELRKLYSGEELGFGYADLSKRVIIPGGSYRSVVVAGVQPGKGETILGDPDGGFPQRWLWLPAYDPAAPDTEPSEPSVWDWSPPGSAGSSSGEIVVMKVAVGIRREIKEDRRARLRGDAADMEAHALYTRLKVAAALSLLSGTDRVSLSDWELAGLVMSVSSRVRAKVEGMLSAKARAENVARGRQEGVRAAVAAESAASTSLVRVGKNVMRLQLPRGEWISEAAMRRKISAADRVLLKEVLAWLVERGSLEERAHVYQGQKGLQYRKAGR